MKFFTENYDESVLKNIVVNGNEQTALISQSTWDNTYKKAMNPMTFLILVLQQFHGE